MATHSSVLVWEIPWTAEPGELQSMRSQSVRYYIATEHMHLYVGRYIRTTEISSFYLQFFSIKLQGKHWCFQMSLETLNMTFTSLKIVTSSWLHSQGSPLMPLLIGRIHIYCYIFCKETLHWAAGAVCMSGYVLCRWHYTLIRQLVLGHTACRQCLAYHSPPPLFFKPWNMVDMVHCKMNLYWKWQNCNVKYTGVSGVCCFLHIFFLPWPMPFPCIQGKKLHLTQKCDVLYCQRLLLF